MLNKSFDQSVTETRALIVAGEIHPASLIDLARNRLRRLGEWPESAVKADQIAAARAVLVEGARITAEFNAARYGRNGPERRAA